jgi:DNA mismatch repair protein MutS2
MLSQLYMPRPKKKNKNDGIATVRVDRSNFSAAQTEINVIGKNLSEAMIEVEAFMDKALVSGLNEIRIVHGVGLRILSKGIHDYLRKHPRVAEYRFGRYGEGEHGVTIVTLK